MGGTRLECSVDLESQLINQYVQCGNLLKANQLFSKIVNANLETWNAIILANSKLGQPDDVIKLYHLMCHSNVKPGSHVFVAVMKACCSLLALQQGSLIHAYTTETGYGSHLFISNSLVDMYAKCGSFEDAYAVFTLMPNRDVVTWNAMITGYTQNGFGDKAYQLLQQMHIEGVDTDHLTFISVLKACSGILALDTGKLIHVFITQRDLLYNACVSNSLLDMYCKCGKFENAQKLFDVLTNKTVVSWNVIISGYAQHSCADKAFGLFQQMLSGWVEPNRATCISILKACTNILDIHRGELAHFYVTENAFDMDAYVGSVLVDMYNKCGSLEDAEVVFNRFSKGDVVLWSAMIAAYVCHGYHFEALDLFQQMQQQGTEPNDVTFLSILKGCSCLDSLDHGKKVHECIKDSKFNLNTSVGNALVDMYIKCGSIEDAHIAFNGLPKKSVITWNTIIGGNVQHGFADVALSLFLQMLEDGFAPDDITLASILGACSSMSMLAEGRLLHAYMLEYSSETFTLTSNALVDMYVKSGNLEDGCNVFGNFLNADVVTWSTIIGGCAIRTDYKMAMHYFNSMQKQGLEPNDVTFTSLISTCCHAGLVDEGLYHFNSMVKNYKLLPNVEQYNCMVDLLGRVGYLTEAVCILLTMPFEPNATVWTSLLSHCKSNGNVELGKICHNAIVTSESAVT